MAQGGNYHAKTSDGSYQLFIYFYGLRSFECCLSFVVQRAVALLYSHYSGQPGAFLSGLFIGLLIIWVKPLVPSFYLF